MTSCLCLRLFLGAFVFAWGAEAQTPPVRSVQLKYTCTIDSIPEGAKLVDLWIPMPGDNQRQTVRLLTAGALREGRITIDKQFGNRMYYRRFQGPFAQEKRSDQAVTKSKGATIQVELVYDIEVHEHVVQAAKQWIATRQVRPAPEMAVYLGDSKMIPIQGRISRLAQDIRLADGEPLRAGRKVYDYLIDTMTYNHKAPGAGIGNAVWACDSKTGDCSDFHSVFIGVCRWRGIPADHVFGLPLSPDKPAGEIHHSHCWAQFWVADIGWIPLDASRGKLFPTRRDYYFGTTPSHWITLTHGRDVVLEPPQHGGPLNMFESPFAEIDGRPTKDVHWMGSYKER
jgi:transglutaminase-like putative cysteine protease